MERLPRYPIVMEVSGPIGMFSDPASGGDSHSYPVPPPSACWGMISAIVRSPGVNIEVAAVGVCFVPKWSSYSFTTRTIHRKADQIKNGSPYLGREHVLVNPTYQILAVLSNIPNWEAYYPEDKIKTTNPAHIMQDQFSRRLRRGRCFRPVSLGRKEFSATYFGVPRSKVQTDYNHVIPVMSNPRFVNGRLVTNHIQNAAVREGVVRFSDEAVCLRNGMLAFDNEATHENIRKVFMV